MFPLTDKDGFEYCGWVMEEDHVYIGITPLSQVWESWMFSEIASMSTKKMWPFKNRLLAGHSDACP